MRHHYARDDRDYLRQVTLHYGCYALRTWETGRRASTGQHHIGYSFEGPDGVLFTGEDYGVAPSEAVDSDAALRGLLSFLCLKPGDTDEEYFEAYTEAQLAWCRSSDAEEISVCYVYDADQRDPEYPPAKFTTLRLRGRGGFYLYEGGNLHRWATELAHAQIAQHANH